MGRQHQANQWYVGTILLVLLGLECISSATVKDVFTPDSPLTRLPRETSYPSRYSPSSSNDKSIQPEESSEGRRDQQNLGKRCIRCESGYSDRSPYDRYRYQDRSRTYDRYDDRDGDRSYDRYERERYPDRDRYYDRYERYPDRSRYSEDDRYSDRDRYSSDRYSDRSRDRYGGSDRYSPYENRDRYDRYDRYDRTDRYPERGTGYDNRGYDYREGYRPWDETYRGTSGFDSAGRGYYFASGRPDYGATSGYGSYGSGGYASGWNYGGNSGSGRDDYYRDRGYGGGGGGGSGGSGGSNSYRYNRDRDPYDSYRTTSYLYGRQSTTTTQPPSDNGSSNTQSPQDNSG